MNLEILNTEVQEFINSNLTVEATKLILKGSPFQNISIQELVEQIEAKKKCKDKLPSWFATENIYFPNKLNIEQTSSEVTAKYKADLISGDSLIDLTGGFGIDCFYFSKQFKHVTHCEINVKLSAIVEHNYKQLQIENIETISKNGLDFLKENNKQLDWIYIDPSRRHDVKGKVFFLNDCLPNVPENLDLLFNHSNNNLIKTSPLIDISAGIKELNFVKSIHIVAVKNEVKELLWVLEKDFQGSIAINTVNLKSDSREEFSFYLNEEENAVVSFSDPKTYLYEPNAAIMKSNGFNSLAEKFQLKKLHKHTHLYTSDTLISDFPGRSFKIEKVIPYSKNLKKENIKQANITTRNFTETVSQIRKKFKIKDGGNTYLFFCTNFKNEKLVLLCSKSKN